MDRSGCGLDRGIGALKIYQGGQLRGGFLGNHVIQAGRVVWVGNEAIACIIGQFRDLSLNMRAFGTPWVQSAKVEMLQHPGHQNGCRTLAIWPMLNQLIAPIRPRNRISVERGTSREILHRVRATHGLQRRDHILRDFAFIKCITALLGHTAQNLRLS